MSDATASPPATGRSADGPGRSARLARGIGAQIRSFVRTPLNLLLLVALPVVVVEGYGIAMEAFPHLPGIQTESLVAMGRVNGAIYAVAFFAGVLGLFQVISARQADRRLGLCGYSRLELFGTRLLTVIVGCLVITAASLAVLARTTTIAAPLSAFAGLALAAVIYGAIGMLVGAVLPRALEGSLVIVFLVDFDDFLSSGMLNIDTAVLSAFPLHFPHRMVRDAVFEGAVATGDAVGALAYALVALLIAALIYARVTAGGVGQ